MKKYLISEEGKFYKANLHCHTTVSDGRMDPEEVKQHYMAHGYSIVAYTDHSIMLPHHDLTDDKFLALTGYETELVAKDTEPISRRRHCHICFIALKKDNETMPYYSPKAIWGRGKELQHLVKFNMDHVFDVWRHDPQIINEIIRLGRQQGFFVTYNHPAWSVERYPQYSQYTGMSAMEILNFGAWNGGSGDYNPRVYEDLLEKGERIFCIAADDNHGTKDACGGWTMIKAPSLEYEAVTDALERGDFYASRGPEIQALWIEDGIVHIQTSPARRVVCSYAQRRAAVRNAGEEPLTHAEFPVIPSDGWFRLTVIDEQGACADTNAYFTDTLFEE